MRYLKSGVIIHTFFLYYVNNFDFCKRLFRKGLIKYLIYFNNKGLLENHSDFFQFLLGLF